MPWCVVILSSPDPEENFVVGPFDTKDEATTWMNDVGNDGYFVDAEDAQVWFINRPVKRERNP